MNTLDTPDTATLNHALKYHLITLALGGYDALLPRVPFSVGRIRDALQTGDENLNSIPLKKWDIAAGWLPNNTKLLTDRWRYAPDGLVGARVMCIGPDMPTRAFGLSLSEAVCVLKHVARHHPRLGNCPLPFDYTWGE